MSDLWKRCLACLEEELASEQYNMWVRPLQVKLSDDATQLVLYAPNRFVVDWVNSRYLEKIQTILESLQVSPLPNLSLRVGSLDDAPGSSPSTPMTQSQPGAVSSATAKSSFQSDGFSANQVKAATTSQRLPAGSVSRPDRRPIYGTKLNRHFTFDNFVEGKSNQMAYAAARQVADNPGSHGYNPLLLYGGVGLGKTHLMHSVGNALLARRPNSKVVYLHSERFVADMVSALRNKTIDQFQRFYRTVDALLIDDIQFFAGKEQSQEEFFHTFNSLMESSQQIILTCDKFPKEIDGLEDRLKSRFGWGLSQPLEPPELETRVAILKKKADEEHIFIPDDVAFFIAQRIRSNVRELEGVLKRVIAHVRFTGSQMDIGLVKDALKDVLAVQARLVSVDNIQRLVADYFNLRITELLSPRRSRSIARPRQVAMALSKELTTKSLPEIGEAFGGRDHTTVLHACRKVAELRNSLPEFEQDYQNILRSLTS